ncbi:hypothetical protein [Robertkochia aurantiaca]|uniref:hypothetical protein n=1 Tax=Robertkochia aurantiaca TaxID=2873700 RepID=UPI001CCE22E1|nr:hypothetical protein [Robertkochia sp. 3YJGBD-33]
MRLEEYWHNCSEDDIPSELYKGIIESLIKLEFPIYNGCSRNLRKVIKEEIVQLGWSEKVELDSNTRINITSMNKEYGLCLQTGNMSRFYADLIKLEYLYKKGKLKGAFYILPSKYAAKIMGSNIANFDRFTHELEVFNKVITTPIIVIGLR